MVKTHSRVEALKSILREIKEKTGSFPDEGLTGTWSWVRDGIDVRRDADGNDFKYKKEGEILPYLNEWLRPPALYSR